MPPTIIVTVGRLAFEPELALLPPPAAGELEELPLDEQALTPRAATHAAAANPSRAFLRAMKVLLDVLRWVKRRESREGIPNGRVLRLVAITRASGRELRVRHLRPPGQ